MPGFAKPQDSTPNETVTGGAPDINTVSNQTFYGFRYNVDTGKLILEILDGDTAVSLPMEGVIKDNDYRQWLWTQKRLKFVWNEDNGHLLVEVR